MKGKNTLHLLKNLKKRIIKNNVRTGFISPS